MKFPFKEKNISEKEAIRTFSAEVDTHELKWHQDKEDRVVVPLAETDWLFQRDNQLPERINGPIEIKANEWHRVIKGNKDLIVKILKKGKNE